MISVHELEKSFSDNHVLRAIDFQLSESGIIAILGPNGCGKTTLLKCILGLVIPDSGDIRLNGASILGQNSYRKRIAHLSQSAQFPNNLSVLELLEFLKELRASPSFENKYIKALGIEKDLHKKINQLSGGTKQKVNLVSGIHVRHGYHHIGRTYLGSGSAFYYQFEEDIKGPGGEWEIDHRHLPYYEFCSRFG